MTYQTFCHELLQTMFNQVDNDIKTKAPIVNTHGSGEVTEIANNFIYLESDTGNILILDSTGAVIETKIEKV